MNRAIYPINSVLIVVAHPDDAEFMCGGTVARMAAEGKEVSLLVVTSGERGGDGSVGEDELGRTREAEEEASAAALGIRNVTFLRQPDGEITPSLELRREIVREIRRRRPDLVITHNPIRHFGHGKHPDHLAVGEATLAAVDPTSGNPMAYPEMGEEGLDAWPVDWVFAFDAEAPDHFEDIGSTVETKLAALLRHRSQMPPAEHLDRAIRSVAGGFAVTAAARGYPGLTYAEAFRRVFTGHASRMHTDGQKVPA